MFLAWSQSESRNTVPTEAVLSSVTVPKECRERETTFFSASSRLDRQMRSVMVHPFAFPVTPASQHSCCASSMQTPFRLLLKNFLLRKGFHPPSQRQQSRAHHADQEQPPFSCEPTKPHTTQPWWTHTHHEKSCLTPQAEWLVRSSPANQKPPDVHKKQASCAAQGVIPVSGCCGMQTQIVGALASSSSSTLAWHQVASAGSHCAHPDAAIRTSEKRPDQSNKLSNGTAGDAASQRDEKNLLRGRRSRCGQTDEMVLRGVVDDREASLVCLGATMHPSSPTLRIPVGPRVDELSPFLPRLRERPLAVGCASQRAEETRPASSAE